MKWVGGRSGGTKRVHRLAWEEAHGPIPDGLFVLHACDNPACYEVTHLFLGTQADNMADKARKGRATNQNKGKTHCKRGHEFTPENTYTDSKGERQCQICKRNHALRRRAK